MLTEYRNCYPLSPYLRKRQRGHCLALDPAAGIVCQGRELQLLVRPATPPNQRSRPATTATTSRLHAHQPPQLHACAYPPPPCALSLLNVRPALATTQITTCKHRPTRCQTSSDGSSSSLTRSPCTYTTRHRARLPCPRVLDTRSLTRCEQRGAVAS
jgi:hypothetical protein